MNNEFKAKAWSNGDELLAQIVDRLGVIGTAGRTYFKKPPDPIRRPYESEGRKAGMPVISFIKAMAGKAKRG